MEEKEYLEHYEQRLENLLAGIYGSEGRLMDVAELEERWHEFAPEYMADAVVGYRLGETREGNLR